jgi:hypothetical protein
MGFPSQVQKAAWLHKTFENGTWGGEIRGEFEQEEGDGPVGRANMCGLLEARVGPLAISDVRWGLPAFLEGRVPVMPPSRCPVRPFFNCRSVSEQELIEFLEATLRKALALAVRVGVTVRSHVAGLGGVGILQSPVT